MKLRRTPVWDRKTYVYRFSNGDRSIVSIGKVTTYHNGTCSVAYDASITAEIIAFLHNLDDKEVRDNLKAINFEDFGMRKERLVKQKQWDEEHTNEENPYDKPIKVIRLNSCTPDATLDMIDNFLYHNSLDEEDESIEEERSEELRKQVEEYVSTLNPYMQELYDLFYVQGLSQNEISKLKHLDKGNISRRKKRLDQRILKKFS